MFKTNRVCGKLTPLSTMDKRRLHSQSEILRQLAQVDRERRIEQQIVDLEKEILQRKRKLESDYKRDCEQLELEHNRRRLALDVELRTIKTKSLSATKGFESQMQEINDLLNQQDDFDPTNLLQQTLQEGSEEISTSSLSDSTTTTTTTATTSTIQSNLKYPLIAVKPINNNNNNNNKLIGDKIKKRYKLIITNKPNGQQHASLKPNIVTSLNSSNLIGNKPKLVIKTYSKSVSLPRIVKPKPSNQPVEVIDLLSSDEEEVAEEKSNDDSKEKIEDGEEVSDNFEEEEEEDDLGDFNEDCDDISMYSDSDNNDDDPSYKPSSAKKNCSKSSGGGGGGGGGKKRQNNRKKVTKVTTSRRTSASVCLANSMKSTVADQSKDEELEEEVYENKSNNVNNNNNDNSNDFKDYDCEDNANGSNGGEMSNSQPTMEHGDDEEDDEKVFCNKYGVQRDNSFRDERRKKHDECIQMLYSLIPYLTNKKEKDTEFEKKSAMICDQIQETPAKRNIDPVKRMELECEEQRLREAIEEQRTNSRKKRRNSTKATTSSSGGSSNHRELTAQDLAQIMQEREKHEKRLIEQAERKERKRLAQQKKNNSIEYRRKKAIYNAKYQARLKALRNGHSNEEAERIGNEAADQCRQMFQEVGQNDLQGGGGGQSSSNSRIMIEDNGQMDNDGSDGHLINHDNEDNNSMDDEEEEEEDLDDNSEYQDSENEMSITDELSIVDHQQSMSSVGSMIYDHHNHLHHQNNNEVDDEPGTLNLDEILGL